MGWASSLPPILRDPATVRLVPSSRVPLPSELYPPETRRAIGYLIRVPLAPFRDRSRPVGRWLSQRRLKATPSRPS